jgi:hypothetical protein
VWYVEKEIGVKTELFDKCTMGWLILVVILALVIGPMIIFSGLSGFVAPNPVIDAQFHLNFIIDKTLDYEELHKLAHHYNKTFVHDVYEKVDAKYNLGEMIETNQTVGSNGTALIDQPGSKANVEWAGPNQLIDGLTGTKQGNHSAESEEKRTEQKMR